MREPSDKRRETSAATTGADRSPRARLYALVMEPGRHGRGARAFDAVMTVVLLANITAILLETVPALLAAHGTLLWTVDAVTILVISGDYVLHLWLCTEEPAYGRRGPVRGRLAYAGTPMALVDLIAIAPWWFSLVTSFDIRFLIVLRLLRLLRLARYSLALRTVLTVLVREWRQLGASLVIVLALLVLMAGGMYRVEGDVQPEAFGSIPRALWWAVAGVTSLGGVQGPVTAAGRLLAAVGGIVGLMAVALPTATLASAFFSELRKQDFVVTWKLVARLPFFRGLDAAQIAAITDLLHPLHLPANQVVMRQGERGDRVYFILSGQVEVLLPDHRVTLSDGAFFGEMALLFDEPRSATVVTDTECRLLCLDRDAFTALLDDAPELRASLGAEVRRRCAEDGRPVPDMLAGTGG